MKRKSVYVIWLIAMLISYILFQNTFFGATLLVLVCMGIVSILIAKVLSKLVEIDIETDSESITASTKLYFSIKITNKTIFPTNKLFVRLVVRNSFFEEEEQCEVAVPVIIKGTEVVTSSVDCRYVGNVKIEIEEAIISDYFGVVKYNVPINRSISVNVKPMESSVQMQWMNKTEEDEDGNKIPIDSLEAYDIKGVREYRDGESLHRIHWNLSCRFDELMIKEYEVETVSSFNVMVDLSKDNVTYINDIFEALCGTIDLILNYEQEFKVYWYDERIEGIREKIITEKFHKEELIEEMYASELGVKAGLVYYNYNLDKEDDKSINAVYVSVDRDNVAGDILGEYNNKVVLMCI